MEIIYKLISPTHSFVMGISISGCNFKLPKNAKKLNDDSPENSRIANYVIGGFHITCRFETFVFNILDNFKHGLGC